VSAEPGDALEPADHARAILNILDDFAEEKLLLADTQRAILNILDDAAVERDRLEATQKAMLNILDDFDDEKQKVERVNVELRRENHERQTTERALIRRSADLARSNADLEQFAYVASHDLQEPLRMVSSYVQLLERNFRGRLDDQADKYIHYAVEGAHRMQALIGGLLEYSRAGVEAARGSIRLDDALDLALSNLKSVIDEADASIARDGLGEAVADTAQLAQVLQNLLGNALKFRRPGIRPTIRVWAEQRGDDAMISVQDNGIGIDPKHAERVFVIFQRLHTRKEYPGTGIGLSICRKVVERHGGRIWVEPSKPGVTFRFTLPRLAKGVA
jgi:light-regulated signal transduction histidine kinase (bacteriophytochrome)